MPTTRFSLFVKTYILTTETDFVILNHSSFLLSNIFEIGYLFVALQLENWYLSSYVAVY